MPEKITLTLEVNAKGQIVLVSTKKAVDELDKALERNRTQTKRTTTAEKAHTEAKQKGTKASKSERDELGRFVGQGRRTERSITRLARAQQKLSNAFAAGFLKAQLFLGVLRVGFRIGSQLALGPIRILTTGLKAMTQQVIQSTERFDKFRITLEGALKSSVRAREISDFVQSFALRTPVKVQDVQDLTKSIALIPALKPTFFGDFKDVQRNLEDLYGTVIGLASLNPQQGIPGAVFAIREALTGQFRSLRARFDVMPQIIAGSINKTVEEIKKSPQLVIAALKEFVNQAVGTETLAKLGALPSIRIDNILEAVQDIGPRQVGTAGFADFIQQLLAQIDDSFQLFFRAGGEFESKYAQQISDRLQGIVIQGIRIVSTLFGSGAAAAEVQPGLAGAAQALIGVLETVERSARRIADSVTANRGNISDFFRSMINGLETLFEAFTEFGEALPRIAPVLGALVQSMFSFVGLITDAIRGLLDLVAGLANSSAGSLLFGDAAQGFIDRKVTDDIAGAVVSGVQQGLSFSGPLAPRPSATVQRPGFVLDGFAAGFGQTVFSNQGGAISQGSDRQLELARAAGEAAVLEIVSRGGAVDAASISGILDEILGQTRAGGIRGPGFGLTEVQREQVDEALKLKFSTSLLRNEFERLNGTVRITNTSPQVGGTTSTTSVAGFTFTRPTQVPAFQASLDAIDEINRRIEGELGGSIDSIKNTGLKAQTRLAKVLLDPLQRAESEFGKVEKDFETAREKLAASFIRIIDEIESNFGRALQESLETGGVGLIRIIEGRDRAIATANAQRTRREGESQNFRSIAQVSGFQLALQELNRIDPRKVAELERQLGGLQRRLAGLSAVEVEGFTATIGTTGARTFADLVTSRNLGDVQRQQAKGPPVRTPQDQLANLNAQLSAVRERSALEERIRDILSAGAVTNDERQIFEERLLEVRNLQIEQLTRQRDLLAETLSFQFQFEQTLGDLGQRSNDAFETSVSDSIFKAFTGDLDGIAAVWDAFLDTLLQAFADFLAKLLVKVALGKALEGIAGIFSGGIGGGTGGGFFGALSGGNTSVVSGLGGAAGGVNVFAAGGISGPTAGGPTLSLVGEGSRNEGIIPLLSNNSIPVSGGHAMLPGGRGIPITFMAEGGIRGVSPTSLGNPSQMVSDITIVNVTDPSQIVAMGLPASSDTVINIVAGDVRNRGPVRQQMRRHGQTR